MKKKSYLVIGLGQFITIWKNLLDDRDVTAIDVSVGAINKVSLFYCLYCR